MADIATLGLAIDSTAARRAAGDLDALAAAAARADNASQRTGAGYAGLGAGIIRVLAQLEQLNATQLRQEQASLSASQATASATAALVGQTQAAQAAAAALTAQAAANRSSAQSAAQAAIDAARLSSSLGAASNAGASAANSLTNIGRAGLVFGSVNAGAALLVNTLRSLPEKGIGFTASMEKAQIGIAGVLASVTAIDGKATSFSKGMEIAGEVAKRLQKEATLTAASTSELISTYQTLLGPGLAAGFNPAQVERFTVVGVNAVKSLGLASNQLAQELKDLVQGGIQTSSSQLAGVLGLKDADIIRAKASAEGLYSFLMRRMEGFAEAGPAYAKSFSGTMDLLHERITMASASLFAPLTDALKNQAAALGEAISNDKNINAMSGIANAIAEIVNALGAATVFAVEHSSAIMSVASAYAAIKFGGIISGLYASTQAAIAASSTSRLKAAQTEVEALANQQLVLTEREKLAAYIFGLEAQAAYTAGLLANTETKMAALNASAAQIEILRAEALAKMEAVRATIAQAEAQLASAQAAGTGTAAIAAQAEATAALTLSQARAAALTAELAALGRQAASVHAATAVAAGAQAAATEGAALASSQLAAAQRAASGAGSIMGGVIGALGGPIGIAIAAVVLLTAKLFSLRSEANAIALNNQSLERVKAAQAAGKAPEARDLQKIPAMIEEAKSRADQLELDIKNNDAWDINGKTEQNRLAKYKKELAEVKQRAKDLEDLSKTAGDNAQKNLNGLQVGSLSATKALEGLLGKHKTARNLREAAKAESDALDSQLKVVQNNQTTSKDASIEYAQRVAEEKKAIATKLQNELAGIENKAAKAGGAGRVAAENPQIKAYANLVASINEKIEANNQESVAGRNLTESEKQTLDIKKMVAKGTISAAEASSDKTKKLLMELSATEKLKSTSLAYAKAGADLQAKADADIKSLDASIAKQREHNAEIGKSKEQIELARAAKIESETESLEVERRAISALLTESDYVGVLKDKDLELYTQRMNNLDIIISKRKEEQSLLKDGAELERKAAENASSAKMLGDAENAAKSVFANIAENGTGAFKKIGQTIKSSLIDMLWELTAKKWIFNVGASITGGLSSSVAGAATGGSGASGIMSNIIGGANPLTNFTGAATNALYSLGGAATNAGLTSIGDTITANAGAMGNFASAAGNALSYVSALSSLSKGNYGSALGSVAGTIFGGPLGSVIGGKIGGLVDGLFKKGNPTSSTGDSNIKFNQAGEETSRLDMSTVTAFKATASTAADDIVRGVQAQYAAAAKSLGISVTDSAFAYSGNTGKGGKESLFALRGGAGNAYYGGNGDVATTPESLKLEASRVILTALQGSELPKYLSGMLDGINAGALNQSQIDQVLNAATAYKEFHAQLSGLPFDNLKDLSYSAASALTAAAGGLEAFNSKLGAYYNNYYSVEEKRAQIIKNINEQTAGSGFDAATATAAGFRKLVEAQDVTTESGRKTYTQLMSVSEAFFGLGENLRKLESDTATLKIELMRAQGNNTGADRAQYEIDTAGLSDAERAVFDYNASIRAQIAELNNAADAAKKADEAAADAAKKVNEAIRAKAKSDIDAAAAALDNAKKSTDAALSALEKSYAAEKARVAIIRDAAAESVRVITGIFDLLKSQTIELYNSVSSTAIMQAAQGNAFIDNALNNAQKTGYLPDQKQLAEAISAARGGLSSTQYATQFEADQAALVTAGKLSQLQEISGTQLSAAEKSLKIAEEQLLSLDAALEYQKEQVNALNGINSSVLSVADAIAGLSGAMAAQKAAQAAVSTAQAAGAASLYASNPNAVKNPGQEGLDFWQGQIASKGYDATASTFDASVNYHNDMVKGWYAGNPDAVKNPDSEAVQYWLSQIDAMGADAAKAKFSGVVGAMTGTALPSYAVGANYIPHDQIAQLHEGEAVVPKAYNPAAGGIGGDTVRLEALVEALTAEVQRLQSIVADGNEHQRRTAVAVNGNPDMPIIVQQV